MKNSNNIFRLLFYVHILNLLTGLYILPVYLELLRINFVVIKHTHNVYL